MAISKYLRIISQARLLTVILAGLLADPMAGCKKGFLNDPAPTASASPADVYGSAAGVRIYFNGIYSNVRSQWASTDGTIDNTTADTYGFNAINMSRVVKGMDITVPGPSWFYYDYAYQRRTASYRHVIFVWYFFYEIINQLNTLIDGTQKSATIAETDKENLIAEARAFRGYLYFELAREFQLTVGKDPQAPGVPIYTTPTSRDSTGNARGTLADVYRQINADMDYAQQHITDGRLLKSQINSSVVWGISARIYLEQGRWADAETAAANAIKNASLDASGYPGNYNGSSSPEVLWAFPQTTGNGGQTLYYGTPSSFYEATGNGYDNFFISAEFAGHFTNTDIRNTFFVYNPDPTSAKYLKSNKFGADNQPVTPVQLITGQTVNLKATDFTESLNLMRVGEMYTILAETKARQGKGDAAATLFALQQNRDPMAVASGNTGQALIDEILLERRKELYGELGIDFLDAKRLQLPIDRTKSNHAQPNNFLIPANDVLTTLQIPQSEIDRNKKIGPSGQNP